MKFSENLPKPLKEGIYEIDEFNNKPLFAVDNSNLKSKLVVSSWQEAYGLVEKFSSDDINPKYISQYLTNEFSTETSPYKKIKRLPRCSTIKITKNGKIEIKKKEPFCSEYHQLSKKNLSSFVKGKLINNLNNIFTDKKYIVGLEHSSGLDSNSILGCLLEVESSKKKIFIPLVEME